jgi:hypothetical protein
MKKAPRRGAFGWLAITSSFWSPSSLLELSFWSPLISPPILNLFTTIAHLLRVSYLFKNIFKTCHIKIQSKNRGSAFFIR